MRDANITGNSTRAHSLFRIACFTTCLLMALPLPMQAEKIVADVTRFSPDEGQPLFPAGNINVFKQYVLKVEESERVGRTVEIDLLFTSIEFGAELTAGVKAAVGLEVGLCFGGNADFDLGFKPTITLPDRYPTEFPVVLTVDEGLMPDSHFTTTFPPLGKAYADLIFDLGAHLNVKACFFGCFDGLGFDFDTCDIPAIGGVQLFKESVRCDPALNTEAYCAVELASFNRGDDNTFRMLNVTAGNRFEFLANPYKEFALSLGTGSEKIFFANSDNDRLQVSGVHRFSDGSEVTVSSTGSLPGGLLSGKTYYVNNLASSGPTGIEFQLARRKGGTPIDLSNMGTGEHKITLSETKEPGSPTIGKYGTISISAPTVGTDSRVSAIDGNEKPFTVNPATDELIITALPGLKNGNKVRISSAGELPDGLNRGCVYYVVNATAGGLVVKLSTQLGGSPVDISDFGTGTHRVALNAEFNSASGLKSTGAEDIMAISVDVITLMTDILFPPSFPSMKDSGSVGPLSWDYTLASLELGPALQLKTDFELTWNLVVTEMTFWAPGTFNARAVKIGNQNVTALSQVTPARTIYLKNSGPNALPAIVLLNTDPVEVRITYNIEPRLKTVVSTPFLGRVKYAALGAGASLDKVGELRFGPLIQGEHNFKIGEFEVYDGDPSPIESAGARTDFNLPQDLERYDLSLVNTANESVPTEGCAEVIIYKTGETLYIRIFDVVGDLITDKPASQILTPAMFAELQDQLDPWPLDGVNDNEKEAILEKATAIAGLKPGKITFTLQAAGPPSYFWSPDQVAGSTYWNQGGTYGIGGSGNPGSPNLTNWIELISIPPSMLSFPGEFGSSSDVTIDASPYPSLYDEYAVGSLKVAAGRQLYMYGLSTSRLAGLTITGGLVENNGLIEITAADGNFENISYLRLDGADPVLTGGGTVTLKNGAGLYAESGNAPVNFTNYNTISGNGDALSLYAEHPGSTINNRGTFLGNTPSSFLLTNAEHVVNYGYMNAYGSGGLSTKGNLLENKAGSRNWAVGAGSEIIMRFDEVNHSGSAFASSGGNLYISPNNFDRTIWNAGQSFSEDVGTLRAVGAGGNLVVSNADVTGGLIYANYEGKFASSNSTFSGSIIEIGQFNPSAVDANSGTMTLNGTGNLFTRACLTNYGTIEVPGSAEFVDTMLFANNGTIVIPQNGLLQIREVSSGTEDPNASESAQNFPGTANATGETLVGGTWDISGTLLIEGAAFTGIGANAALASTSSGSIDEVAGADPDVVIEDDLDRVLSLGNPAMVILRKSSWSFPALDTLESNDGTLYLYEGADFPSGPTSNRTAGDFTNRGQIRIDSSSILKVGGGFIQDHPDALTEILALGELSSSTGEFRIIGGSVIADPTAQFMNRTGNTFFPGTTIYVESPMIDTDEIDPFTGKPVYEQRPVSVNLGPGINITSIDAGVDVTIHGSAVYFPSLTESLESNAGRFTISGDGIDNPGQITVAPFTGDEFINTGELNILGYSSELTAADFTQNGAGASTRIGAGATLRVFGQGTINGGSIHVEIASRPSQNIYGTIRTNNFDFGNALVIDFTDSLAASMPDVGDTWEIMSRTISTNMSGVSNETITYTLNGDPLPDGWLPAGTHLEVIRFNTVFGPRGLGIRVTPDAGFISYDSWVLANAFDPASPLSDPLRDADENGVLNSLEYLFGPSGDGGFIPEQQQQQRLYASNGELYLELRYKRSVGVDASYQPLYSQDLKNWFPAAMVISDITPDTADTGLEWVTLNSTFSVPTGQVFFIVRGDLNVDAFDYGILPTKPINHSSGLNSFNEVLRDDLGLTVDYIVEPGKVLYFNVRGKRDDSIYGGTAPNGVDRNYIYQARSSLGVASVHAGVLNDQEQGIVKVTFIPPQQTPFIGSTQNQDTNNQVTSESAEPIDEPYSYFIQRHSGDANN